jgi:hypothetical protein
MSSQSYPSRQETNPAYPYMQPYQYETNSAVFVYFRNEVMRYLKQETQGHALICIAKDSGGLRTTDNPTDSVGVLDSSRDFASDDPVVLWYVSMLYT